MPDQLDFQDPSGQGLLYMGPELSPEDEAALRRRPGGTRIMPQPPQGAEAMALQEQRQADLASVPGARSMEDVAAWNRVAATDTTTTHTLPGVSRPELPSPDEEIFNTATRLGVPIDKAMAAIESQRRFQAQRGYQADLAGGMSAQAAIAKWAPLLFGQRGAAAIPKFTPPPTAQPKTYRDQQGNLWYQKANGEWTHIQNPKQPTPPTDTFVAKMPEVKERAAVPGVHPGFFGRLLGQEEVPDLPARTGSPGYTLTRRGPAGTVTPPPGFAGSAAPAAPATAKPREVRRKTKDGRTALFDANTREFIRYADD
jgi:hypothetical protein